MPLELSVTVRVALRVPVPLGVKVTLMVQDELAANWPPRVLHVSWFSVSAKSAWYGPEIEMANVSTALLAFTSVTVGAGLVVVFACPANVRLLGETFAPPPEICATIVNP